MKLVDLVKIGAEMLKMMSENDVKLNDWKYVKMHEEYVKMRAEGIKYRAVIAILADKYNTSEASIERIVRRLSKDC